MTVCLIRSVCQTMAGLFSIVYLYRQGLGLDLILFYSWFIFGTGIGLNNLVIGRILSRLGPVRTIALSNLALILFCFLILNLQPGPGFLILLALPAAFSKQSYRLARHAYMAATVKTGSSGRQTSRLYSLKPLGSVIGQIMAGLVGWWFGGSWIFTIMIGFLIISAILSLSAHRSNQAAIIRLKDIKPVYNYFRSQTKLVLTLTRDRLYFMITSTIWIFHLALTWNDRSVYGLVGLCGGLSALMAIYANNWTGRMADQEWPKLTLTGNLLDAGTGLLKVLGSWLGSAGLGLVYLADTFVNDIGREIRTVNHHRWAYNQSKNLKNKKLEFFLALETIEMTLIWLILSALVIASFLIDSELIIIRTAIGLTALIAVAGLIPGLIKTKPRPGRMPGSQ